MNEPGLAAAHRLSDGPPQAPSVEKHDDVIEHNFIVLGPYNGANYGLDFDDGTRNLSITNNIVYGASQRAVRYDLDETGAWVISLVALVHAYTPWGCIV